MKRREGLIAAVAFFCGLLLAFLILTQKQKESVSADSSSDEDIELHSGQNQLINPLINCPAFPKTKPPKQAALEKRLEDLIEQGRVSGEISRVSVFFRDLANGPAFSLGLDQVFVGASLLKVPLMVGFLKKLGDDPKLWDRKLKFDAAIHQVGQFQQSIVPKDEMKSGESYSVQELLERMVTQSDNRAAKMLIEEFPDVDLFGVLQDMGIKMAIKNDDAWLTSKDYAAIFRILFNATYLDQVHSQKALQLLSRVHFRDGLVAGVPESTLVAHKFGERFSPTETYFHDCGIVYFPKRPYLLCVMTNGKDMSQMIKFVARMSKAVYLYVSDTDS